VKTVIKRLLLDLPGFQALCRLLTRRHVRALMYHRFSAVPGDEHRHTDGPVLRRQLERIVRHHSVWTPDDHLASLQEGNRPAGRCPVVVTVDDGYRDFLEVAFPELQRLRIPAMLFVTTGFVDGTLWFWWDRLQHVFASASPQRLRLTLGGSELDLNLRDETGRRRAWNQVADRCRFLPDAERRQALERIEEKLGVDPPDLPPTPVAPLTWNEVRTMDEAGILYGAHTVHHPILSRVASDDARREIAESGRRLAEELGHGIHWFCYPQGGPADYTPAVKDMVARAGYKGGYLAFQDMQRPVDPFAMPRYCIVSDEAEFAWMLCGAEYLFLRLRYLLGQSTDPGASYWSGSEGGETA